MRIHDPFDAYPYLTAKPKGGVVRAARVLRSGRAWRKKSIRIRRSMPVCFGLNEDHERPTTLVHHIVSVEDDPSAAYDDENLVAICRGCHDFIEGVYARDRRKAVSRAKKYREEVVGQADT